MKATDLREDSDTDTTGRVDCLRDMVAAVEAKGGQDAVRELMAVCMQQTIVHHEFISRGVRAINETVNDVLAGIETLMEEPDPTRHN